MSDMDSMKVGSVVWRDLTVKNAVEIKGFYEQVVGWISKGEDMGGYEDYHLISPGSENSTAGICHARGQNADLPPVWLAYFKVKDADQSAKRCVDLGGKIIAGPRDLGGNRFCVIQDPAGAICALIS